MYVQLETPKYSSGKSHKIILKRVDSGFRFVFTRMDMLTQNCPKVKFCLLFLVWYPNTNISAQCEKDKSSHTGEDKG